MLPGIFTGERRILLVRLVANGFGQLAAAFATAWLAQRAFERMLQPAPATGELALLGVGLAGCAFAVAWLRTRERIDAERAGQSYATDLRLRMFDRLRALPLGALAHKRRGSLIMRFVGDLKALRLWVSLGLSRLAVASVCGIGGLLALSMMHLGLAVAAASAIAIGAASLLVAGRTAPLRIREARRQQARVTAHISERLGAIATMQVNAQMARERERLHVHSERLADAMTGQAGRLAWLRGIGDATSAVTAGAVLLVGAYMVTAGQVSVSTVVAATTLVGIMVSGLRDLGLVYGHWEKARISRQKLIELLAWPNLPMAEGHPLVVSEGRVEFREVAVAGTLRALTQLAQPRERIALVGDDAAGKSAVLQLAVRLIDPDAGCVCVDGQDLSQAELETLRAAIGMVSTQLPLLRGTVEQNLRYRRPEASDDEIAAARRWARLDEVLQELPQGLATRLWEGGGNLSARQRGRIALARALLGSPRIVLIDDVEALFGADDAALILGDALRDYPGTLIYAVQDAQLARFADRAWLLDAGVLVAAVAPTEVLRNALAPGCAQPPLEGWR